MGKQPFAHSSRLPLCITTCLEPSSATGFSDIELEYVRARGLGISLERALVQGLSGKYLLRRGIHVRLRYSES
jgi:hypothetical protein